MNQEVRNLNDPIKYGGFFGIIVGILLTALQIHGLFTLDLDSEAKRGLYIFLYVGISYIIFGFLTLYPQNLAWFFMILSLILEFSLLAFLIKGVEIPIFLFSYIHLMIFAIYWRLLDALKKNLRY